MNVLNSLYRPRGTVLRRNRYTEALISFQVVFWHLPVVLASTGQFWPIPVSSGGMTQQQINEGRIRGKTLEKLELLLPEFWREFDFVRDDLRDLMILSSKSVRLPLSPGRAPIILWLQGCFNSKFVTQRKGLGSLVIGQQYFGKSK